MSLHRGRRQGGDHHLLQKERVPGPTARHHTPLPRRLTHGARRRDLGARISLMLRPMGREMPDAAILASRIGCAGGLL
jgi:hypothetical protein